METEVKQPFAFITHVIIYLIPAQDSYNAGKDRS